MSLCVRIVHMLRLECIQIFDDFPYPMIFVDFQNANKVD